MESSERTYGKKFFGLPKDGVDPTLYKNVYYGDVEAESLEEVYSMFNDNRPYTFHGHSLSVSDIVQVCNENEDLVTTKVPILLRISASRKSTSRLPKRRNKRV